YTHMHSPKNNKKWDVTLNNSKINLLTISFETKSPSICQLFFKFMFSCYVGNVEDFRIYAKSN
ncbi:MAG: hypothetical protein V4591_09135, partial [Bdellovibrionota bacterium]